MILLRLREKTGPKHARLEAAVDLPKRLATLSSYTGLLERFYGIYEPLESRLASNQRLEVQGLGADRLCKHQLLAADLLNLGYSRTAISSIPRCPHLPPVGDVAAAIGCQYVLEGATLGGQIVRREFERRFHLAANEGCLFFQSYGAQVGSMWAQFCSVLTAFDSAHPSCGESIVDSASDTFACFEDWVTR